MGAGEEPIDDFLVRISRIVLQKGRDLLGRWRQADQIKCDAPQQGPFLGRRCELESLNL